MKRIALTVLVILAFGFLLYAGCGGGGGTSPTQPTTAVVTLSTSGSLPANTVIGGVEMTINLPAGASVKTTSAKANKAAIVTYDGVVVVSGVAVGANTLTLGTSLTPEQLEVQVTNPNGFGVGEFATVNFEISTGSTVAPSDFTAVAMTAVDLNGAPIQGLTPGLTAVIQ